jgi:hypothetical protein
VKWVTRKRPKIDPGAALAHAWERCSFDAFIAAYRLSGNQALVRLAAIVPPQRS